MHMTKFVQIRIAICDNDPALAEQVEQICRQLLKDQYLLEIKRFASAEELLNHPPVFDIAILAVQMKDKSGIDVAREILDIHPGCCILFISGQEESVSAVYQVPHTALVMKQELEKWLPFYLERAAGVVALEAGQTLTIQDGKSLTRVPLSEIMYIERIRHWTYIIKLDGQKLRTREKLDDLILRIGNPEFCRCHMSYIVNIHHVCDLKKNDFALPDQNLIPISRSYEKQARGAYYGPERHINGAV